MKNLFRTTFMLLMCAVISLGAGGQVYAYSAPIDSSADYVSPQADIIEWRYKVENGNLYRRLFNYTQNKWIGDWELAV